MKGTKMPNKIEFKTEEDAITALKMTGFSIGTNQRDDPRAVYFGDYDIEKWRNLSATEKNNADIIYTRIGGRDGYILLAINDKCPKEAHHKLKLLAA